MPVPLVSSTNLVATLIAFFLFAAEGHAAERPNIVLLLADDLGYRDLSCFGATAVNTPAIDALADRGMKLTRFYSASAVCTPTRASILTGRYPLRFDIRRHFPDDETHLPGDPVALARLLRDAGYLTAHVGKWHLGGLHLGHLGNRDATIPGPHEHGFEHYLTQNEEQPLRGRLGSSRRVFRDGGRHLIRDEAPVGPGDPHFGKHYTDVNGDEAIAVIERAHAAGRPFFLNLWWLVPHKPYEPAPAPHWAATAAAGITDDQHRFRSMVEHMDAKIGEIVATLDRLGLTDDTLIAFTSDNGAAFEGDIGDLRGGKTDLHDGGLRVPFVAHWPGHIPSGTTADFPAVTTDLLPTFCAIASVPLPEDAAIDGLDFSRQLRGEAATAEQTGRSLFWQVDLYRHLQRHYPKPKPYSTEAVLRNGWKLLTDNGEPRELFCVDDDPHETQNLISAYPDLVAELADEITQFLEAPRDRRGFVE